MLCNKCYHFGFLNANKMDENTKELKKLFEATKKATKKQNSYHIH